jgi:hypothetical protein
VSAYRAAVATLRRCADALAADPSPEHRAAIVALLSDTTALLEAAADRRRLATAALAERVARLERQLADRDPGERREVICTRLGLSKASYYRLRQVAHASRSDETCAR